MPEHGTLLSLAEDLCTVDRLRNLKVLIGGGIPAQVSVLNLLRRLSDADLLGICGQLIVDYRNTGEPDLHFDNSLG